MRDVQTLRKRGGGEGKMVGEAMSEKDCFKQHLAMNRKSTIVCQPQNGTM